MVFNPNQITLQEGIDQIKITQKKLGISQETIFTSKDIPAYMESLPVKNVPVGFNKWMLPFYTDGAATFYISSAGPNSVVPEHAHDEGAGIRFIMSGSIEFKDQLLSQGDWMYMPANSKYEFTVGNQGVSMFYCYQCCCAGALN